MKKVHFLGIGGSGASAAAAIAKAQGYEVTGCDLEPHNEFTTQFESSQLLKGHNPKHLHLNSQTNTPGVKLGLHPRKIVDILAVTPAIFSLDPKNPELLEAKKLGIPILTWQKFTGKYLAKDKFVIAVAGTHGKTTTAAMIARVLEDTGLDPTVLLGTINPRWDTNYRIQRQTSVDRRYFIVEADEFNDNFLNFKPNIAVVTNIEMDHPEYFKDFQAVKLSFRQFLQSTKQKAVVNLSDPGVKQTLASYLGGVNVIIDYSKKLIAFPLQIPGEFNKWNASAAFQVGLILRIDPTTIRKSLANYKGIGRRFEYIGKLNGAKIYSDFGHHPTEIKVTMEAARQKFPKQKIWLIYEPHMFTRTKALFNDFVKVFKNLPIDIIIITDIYPSREVDTGLVTSQQLVDAVRLNTVVYCSKNDIKKMLTNQIQRGDVLFFMGAGDIDKLARNFVNLPS